MEQHFETDISSWLESLGYTLAVQPGSDPCWKLIFVLKQQKNLLTLAVIGMQSWAIGPDMQRLEGCFARVHEIRGDGGKCVVLWEDYWINKKDIVQSRLATLLGTTGSIPGRLTSARRITELEVSAFLDRNHLQGNVSSKFRLALFLPERYFRVLPADFRIDRNADEIMVAAATFSNARTFQRPSGPYRSYELIRFANALNLRVVGGFDKLIRAFVNERQPDDIMTYADNDWSAGESYQKLGFETKGNVPPQPFFVDIQSMQRLSPRQAADDQSSLVRVFNMGSTKFVKTFSGHE